MGGYGFQPTESELRNICALRFISKKRLQLVTPWYQLKGLYSLFVQSIQCLSSNRIESHPTGDRYKCEKVCQLVSLRFAVFSTHFGSPSPLCVTELKSWYKWKKESWMWHKTPLLDYSLDINQLTHLFCFIADHITKLKLDKVCAASQSSHQKHMFESVFVVCFRIISMVLNETCSCAKLN